VNKNHVSLVKPENRDDTSYLFLRNGWNELPTDKFSVVPLGNPTLVEMVEKVKMLKHVAIGFGPTCKAAQIQARIQANGAQLSGTDVPDFFEHEVRPRMSVKFSVLTRKPDISYEIICSK
jgi:hypothetical protein